jgi:hypothetical protein
MRDFGIGLQDGMLLRLCYEEAFLDLGAFKSPQPSKPDFMA